MVDCSTGLNEFPNEERSAVHMGYRTVRLFRPLGNTSLSCQGSLHALRPFLCCVFRAEAFRQLDFWSQGKRPRCATCLWNFVGSCRQIGYLPDVLESRGPNPSSLRNFILFSFPGLAGALSNQAVHGSPEDVRVVLGL